MMHRTRDWRRAKGYARMWRRAQEDANQHYDDLTCPCIENPKPRFWESPQVCSSWCCGNQRRWAGPSIQERRDPSSLNGED